MTQTSPTKTPRFSLVVTLAVLVAALDQLSKLLIVREFLPGQLRPIIPGLFNLTLTYNHGAAFGLWGGLSEGLREVVLGATILIALGVVWFFLRQPAYQNKIGQSALAAILGGALGNIIDRVFRGAVVDFLDVFYGEHHWPAFNVADSAICVGVVVLLLLPQPREARDQLVGEQASGTKI
jgi:signal peptidase II